MKNDKIRTSIARYLGILFLMPEKAPNPKTIVANANISQYKTFRTTTGIGRITAKAATIKTIIVSHISISFEKVNYQKPHKMAKNFHPTSKSTGL